MSHVSVLIIIDAMFTTLRNRSDARRVVYSFSLLALHDIIPHTTAVLLQHVNLPLRSLNRSQYISNDANCFLTLAVVDAAVTAETTRLTQKEAESRHTTCVRVPATADISTARKATTA